MSFSDRVAERLHDTGQNAFEAARAAGLGRDFVNDILNGKKKSVQGKNLERLAAALETTTNWLVAGEGARSVEAPPNSTIPIMGYIGAGAEIDPDYEQIPPNGIDQVELSFPVPEEIIGFKVRGDSMRPRFYEGDVVLVYRDQTRDSRDYVGAEAAVRTVDNRRYIKNLLRGPTAGTFTLESWNAKPIEGVRLAWIGEIYLIVPAAQLRAVDRAQRALATRRRNARAAETKGMTKLL